MARGDCRVVCRIFPGGSAVLWSRYIIVIEGEDGRIVTVCPQPRQPGSISESLSLTQDGRSRGRIFRGKGEEIPFNPILQLSISGDGQACWEEREDRVSPQVAGIWGRGGDNISLTLYYNLLSLANGFLVKCLTSALSSSALGFLVMGMLEVDNQG